MKSWLSDTRMQVLTGVVILGGAIILGVTKFKLPTANVNLNINQSPMQTVTPNSTNYRFPGLLPDDRIQTKQARMVTSRGEIIVALDPAQAPLAVSNFVYLVEQGYYDGILWHRVEDWVVQAGDPQTKNPAVDPELWGRGGPGYTFQDEPVTASYLTGIIAMANAGPNTNGSQFFILKQDYPLPPKYTIFGRVTSGLEIVQALVQGDRIERVTIEPAA